MFLSDFTTLFIIDDKNLSKKFIIIEKSFKYIKNDLNNIVH